MNRRMNRERLNIGAYILDDYARSEAHIRDAAASGLDFIVCMENDRPALDLFAKYGLGAIVTGVVPGWWGGDGDRAGQLEKVNPIESYEAAAKAFADHPAVWGIDAGDEPSALDFPYYGKVIDRMNEIFPNQFAYLNLYPNYASVSQNSASQTVNQLGTPTYKEHIEAYCKNVGTDYICYDFYVYSINVPKMFDNLCVIADACRRTGRSMWIVLQVNSHVPEKWISLNQLRYQAYTAMAFGAENIIWACYTAGWWYNQVVDENGNKTEQYNKMKSVNAEIRMLADNYMKYRCTETRFVGFGATQWLEGTNIVSEDSLSNGFFADVHAEDGRALVIGDMAPRVIGKAGNGRRALFICACDDPYDEHTTATNVVFKTRAKAVSALSGSGKKTVCRMDEETYSVQIASNEGLLIEIE